MAKTKSFDNVTSAIWECIKATSAKEHGTEYAPPNGNEGKATTSTAVGRIVLNFSLDPDQEMLTYTIEKKPFLVSENQIWSGIQDAIERCRS